MQRFVRQTPFITDQIKLISNSSFACAKQETKPQFLKRPKINGCKRELVNKRIDNVLTTMREINEDVGYNMFDNEGWREWGISEVLQKNGYESFTLMNSRVGRDAQCPCHNLNRIEIKTSKITTKRLRASNGFAEFCRQNTKQGIETASNGYDGIIIALFSPFNRQPLLVVFINSVAGICKFQQIIAEKQSEFTRIAAEQDSTMVNGRDSIRVTLDNVYKTLNAQEYEVYYSGERVNVDCFLEQLYSKEGLPLFSSK